MAKSKEPKPTAVSAGERPPAAPKAAAPPSQPAYTVVARRYRPQQFADLIGQEHVAQALTNAITSGRIAHAYLFTGARGTGKTSTARILAKALNCAAGPTPTPCDACDICKSIAAGDDSDAIEIDGASNNKVDEARELRSNAGYLPTRGRFKIYIIDEVHMLSTGAFNALLKTMEEPPPHVKFILATTDPHKIPITILSRCQRYDFAPVSARRIFDALKHVAGREGIAAEPEALRLIARRANGSMRDSQTLLDQLLASADGTLTAEQVNRVFGTLAEDQVLVIADAIAAGDAKRAVELIGTAAERGLQLGELLDQLTDHWRNLMLVAVGGGESAELSEQAAERVKAHAAGSNLDAILAGLEILTATKGKLKGSPHAQVLLEVAAVRLAKLSDLLSVAELTQWITQGTPAGGSAGAQRLPAHLPVAPPAEAVKKKVIAPPETKPEANGQAKPSGDSSTGWDAGEPWEQTWAKVKDQIGANSMLVGFLRLASESPAILGPNSLAIAFSPAYSSAYESVRGERNQEMLRHALRHVTGRDWAVRVEILPDAVAPPTNGVHPAPPPPPSAHRSRNELLALPMFAAASEVLGAQLMRADDGFDPHAAPPPAPDAS